MRYNRNRAILILMTATILLLSTSLYITSFSISDADPSTYTIVPILMLPLFLLFTFKTKFEPEIDKGSVAVGAGALLLFILLVIVFRFYLSFLFVSFKIELLLLPLAIVGLISLLFGSANIGRFRGVLVYSLLASPVVLYPIIALSTLFTQFNTLVVYAVVKLFVSGASYAAPISISANGYNIAIGQTCVSIGIFIALALFLIPIAYLYNGTTKNKVKWLASSLLILLVLNLVRMLSISLIWVTQGPNATALLVHNFIGILLFYLIIVWMLLRAKHYGLEIGKRTKSAKNITVNSGIYTWTTLVAIGLSLVYVYLTLNFSTSLQISPVVITSRVPFNFSNAQISGAIAQIVNKNNFTSFAISNQNGTYVLYSLSNKTINATKPIVLVVTGANSGTTSALLKNNTLVGQLGFLNNRGTTEQVFDLMSQNTEFLTYSTSVPLVLPSNSSAISGFYVLIPVGELPRVSCSSYSTLYSGLFNLFNGANYNTTTKQKIISMECISNKIVWS